MLASLTLNQRMMQIYVDSVAVNQEWAVRQGKYSELGELASEVNAPGNDVFDTRDVKAESARMRAALHVFNAQFDAARADVMNNVTEARAPQLLADFDVIYEAMREMVTEAERIFGYFAARQGERAGERMATMDRKYASVNRALARLARSARAIQASYFDQQIRAAETLKRLQYLIVGLVILMIIGALYYGSRIFKAVQAADAERMAIVEALTQARAAADAANQAKSKFLANMSHEIRTPLSTVFLTLDMLKQSTMDEDQKSYLEMAKTSSRSLQRLIDDLLDLSKIESGNVRFEVAPFDLRAAVRQTAAPFAARAAAKGLAFAVDIAVDAPRTVQGDAMRIGQIVANLLDNAVKFTHAGSVRVQVARRADAPAKLDAGGRPKAALRIAVRDTGIGLSAEQRAHILEDLSQADESTTRKYGGTGLGLSIARRLAALMGGEIGIETDPGEGSTFWLDLDLAAGGRPATSPPTPGAGDGHEPELTGRRVLLVDDSPETRTLFTMMLRQLGMKVDAASNGEQAVMAALASRYDVILMDVAMPVMDGFEATRRIRQHEQGGEEVPIIALTAHAMEDMLEKCLDAGMDDRIAKPFTREDVVAALRRWLSAKGRAAE